MVLVIGKYSDKSNAEPLVRPLSGKRVEGEVKVTNNLRFFFFFLNRLGRFENTNFAKK